MKQIRYTPEQIVRKLRSAEAALAAGTGLPDVLKEVGVSEATYYRWRKEYASASPDKLKQLKDLQKENERLKRIVADQQLDNEILKEALKGKS